MASVKEVRRIASEGGRESVPELMEIAKGKKPENQEARRALEKMAKTDKKLNARLRQME
jgi:3-methyladenine DNA glycosylase AlkC